MKYRPEIDGLRALAIIPVLLFHAGFKAFSGGFIGVDIFFVISGYLITTIIYEEIKLQQFSLLDFYERRARRILPALYAVMAISIPCAWMWLMPRDMWEFSKSLGFILISLSNSYFFSQAGYFAAASELKPLIHTWSLAVEEQYYWLFPIFIIFLWKINKKFIFPILVLVILLSLFYAQYLVSINPESAFFLLPSRIWELLIGSCIAIYLCNQKIHKQKTYEYISFIGLFLISISIYLFNQSTQHPSLYTLIPVTGTALVILFATNKNITGKLLSHKSIVAIGLISYSTYLWHQPLLSFARHRSINEPSQQLLFLLIVCALGLGYLSWKYIEQPFRNKRIIQSKTFFSLVGLFSLIFIYFGSLGYLNGGYPNRNMQELLYKRPNIEIKAKALQIPNKQSNQTEILQDIKVGIYNIHYFGDSQATKTIAIYGDSHAEVLIQGLNEAFRVKKIKGAIITIPNTCEPIPYFVISEINQSQMKNKLTSCTSSFMHLLAWFKSNVEGVIVHSRWTEKLYPIKGEIDSQPFNNEEGGVELDLKRKDYLVLNNNDDFTTSKDVKVTVINNFINSFDSLNMPIYLIYPAPEMGWNIPRMNYKTKFLTGHDELKIVSIPYEVFKKRNRFINRLFDSIRSKNIIKIKPEDIFCNTFIKNRCVGQTEKTTFYSDDDHLSTEGVTLLIPSIIGAIKN
jgi:peptidoglycan/LPS O-acetylase OafA/YrhL